MSGGNFVQGSSAGILSVPDSGASGSNFTKLFHMTCPKTGMAIWVPFLKGRAHLNFWRAKKVQNLARFLKTSEFGREYLRNRSRYRQAENGVINYTITPTLAQKMRGDLTMC